MGSSFLLGRMTLMNPISMMINYTRMFPNMPHSSHADINRDATDLELSDAQKEVFAGWRRPHETFGRPPESGNQDSNHDGFSIVALNEIDLVQDITTDCSVVASLCAGIARALKGHGKVI
jgi:hypothetical protein